jgi:hypothetical protein
MAKRIGSLLWGVVVSVVACGDSNPPLDPLGPPSANEIDIPMCGLPWMPLGSTSLRVKYGPGTWQTVTRVGDRFRLRKAPKIVLNAYTTFIAATGDELAELQCSELPSFRTTRAGTVTNLEPALTWRVMPGTGFGREGNQIERDFQIPIPDTGADIVLSSFDSIPHRVIVRRNVPMQENQPMPVFDLAGPEATPFDVASLTIQGANRDSLFPVICFTSGPLQLRIYGGDGLYGGTRTHFQKLFAVPPSLLKEGDYHQYILRRRDVSYGFCRDPYSERIIPDFVYFYREAEPTTLSVGPQLSAPSLAVDQSRPCFPARASLPSQPEYPDFVQLRVYSRFEIRTLWITKAYLGETPTTWSADMPGDLVDDFCPDQSSQRAIGVAAIAGSGRLGVALGGVGEDGEVLRTASRTLQLPWP